MSPAKKRNSQKNSKKNKTLRRKNRISKKNQSQDSTRKSAVQSEYMLQPDEWVVPMHDGTAYIHHGHEDSDDHSLCGPQFFCCPNAAALFTEIYPDFQDPETKWLAIADKDLLEWRTPQRFYFYYCDEKVDDTLFFIGLDRADFENVIQRETPIHNWDDVALRISKEV